MKEFPRVEKEFSIGDQEFPKVEQVRIVTKTSEEDCVARKKRRGRPSLGRLERDKRLAANMRENYIREGFI